MQTPDPAKKRLTRITCAPFTADILRAEVEALGFEIQEQDAVGVHVGASLFECMALNLRLRTAQHVLWLLHRFRCPSPDALYKEVAAYPWEELIENDGYVSVVSSVEHPKVTNSLYPTRVVKDAIVDRIADKTGARPDSGPDRSQTVVNLFWKGDRAWVYLNTSGERLGDRGYRKLPHTAPMRETLAAAVLLSAGYDGNVPLMNPMCGSGTLAIEAALLATGRAPGLLRSNYGLLHTTLDVDGAWREARREAGKCKRAKELGPVPPIVASDHDPSAIDAARRNARAAGVEQHIEFVECDFAETPLRGGGVETAVCGEGAEASLQGGGAEAPVRGEGAGSPRPVGRDHGAGMIIMNPEYGERMGDAGELVETYERIGDFFKQRCAGWTGFVFTGSRELAGKIGLRASSRTPFMNAKIECRLLRFELYEGSRAEARDC
jgi:putative N6-adenine-specific DNA methylase